MDYKESMEYIQEITKNRGISLGLDNMNKMLDLFNRPENAYKIIHVCGTNGKGSISAYIASILSCSGYKVGRYVSPVVSDYTEKIQFSVDDKLSYIREKNVAEYITKIRKIADNYKIYPTPFEVETIMSLMAFKDNDIDYAIIECGMGGESDATNAISHKELCVFSTVALDHTDYLGYNIKEIAVNKSGIIQDGVKIVSSPQKDEVKEVLDNVASKCSTIVEYANEEQLSNCRSYIGGSSFTYKEKEYSIQLSGKYQIINAITALEAITLLNIDISYEDVLKGLKKTEWPARFEIVSEKPLIIYDGAHNPHGMKAFIESVNELFGVSYKKVAVVGMFADKDIYTMVEYMKDTFDEIHTVTAGSVRALPADELADIISRVCEMKVFSQPDKNVSDIIGGMAYDDKTVFFVFGTLSIYNRSMI